MESAVDTLRIGVMVTEGGFIRYVNTPEGWCAMCGLEQYGLLTHDAARVKFKELCSAPDAVCDRDNPQNEIQVRIPFRKEVNYRDTAAKIKLAESTRKTIKNPDEAQFAQIEETLRQDMEGVLGSKRDLLTCAQETAIASSGSASAFDDSQLRMSQLRYSIDTVQDAEDKESEEKGTVADWAAEGDEVSLASKANAQKEAKKQRWFDRTGQ
eukprot:4989087-Amphidinium_carterae.1